MTVQFNNIPTTAQTPFTVPGDQSTNNNALVQNGQINSQWSVNLNLSTPQQGLSIGPPGFHVPPTWAVPMDHIDWNSFQSLNQPTNTLTTYFDTTTWGYSVVAITVPQFGTYWVTCGSFIAGDSNGGTPLPENTFIIPQITVNGTSGIVENGTSNYIPASEGTMVFGCTGQFRLNPGDIVGFQFIGLAGAIYQPWFPAGPSNIGSWFNIRYMGSA